MEYALVTGGSRGIGRAICVALAKRGYNILINFTSNAKAAEETAALVKAEGVDAQLIPFDVSNREAVKKALANWESSNENKGISILINNAGIRKDNLTMWLEDQEWDDVVDISLGGMYNVTKAVLPGMMKLRKGRIVNMVSLSGLKGMPGQINYSAAKAGIIGATKALSQEVARRNVTVNAVAPGFIKTDMTEDIDEKEMRNMIPARRFGTTEEVASLVGFLCSPEAAYITGETIAITGGLY